VVALGLVTIVAMEAHGAAWNQHRGGEVRSLPHGVIVAGGVCAAAAAAVLFILMLVSARATETPQQRRRRWATAISFLIVIAMISVLRLLVHPSHTSVARGSTSASATGRPTPSPAAGEQHTSATWWPLVIVGLGTAAAFVAATARRSGARAATDTEVDDATIAMLDASLDDLRREPDARRAVTAAYARMERGLAARGFARQPSETPTEYFRRALSAEAGGSAVVGVEPLGELTTLAERARFSAFAIDETMRSRAIAALETLRGELRPAGADLGRVG
jgi:Domain of unknown function (DUF4129)